MNWKAVRRYNAAVKARKAAYARAAEVDRSHREMYERGPSSLRIQTNTEPNTYYDPVTGYDWREVLTLDDQGNTILRSFVRI